MSTYFINITLVSSFLLLTAYLTMASESAANMASDKFGALNEVTHGTNSFAFNLYRALSAKNPNTNVFTSPLSLQMVMALAYSGANGKTADEIATVLKMPKDIANVFNGYNALINLLKNPVLNIATKMFLEKTFKVKEDFSKNVAKYFESDAEQLNFKSDSNGAKNIINNWVEEKTNNKIKDLISDGDLNPDTVMVLVNAIHFKANWRTPFPASSTHPEKFYINNKDTIEVEMMFKSDDFGYAENKALDAKILELPYEGDEFSMYIFLPNQITGLAALEEAMSKVNIIDVLKEVHTNKVDVSLPKFEITQTIDLNDILKSLGVNTMFSEQQADFSGISDERIYVSKVIQKAFIQVDEKGTEAAAATGFVMLRCCAPAVRVVRIFKADHPFLFVITKDIGISMQNISDNDIVDGEILFFIGHFSGQ